MEVQQTSAPAPVPPPQLPVAPGAATSVAPELSTSVPQSREAVSALRAQRSELSSQLTSALRRRESLAKQLDGATAAERPGLEARIQQLDARILALETDIARTGQLLAQAPGQYLSRSEQGIRTGVGNMNIDLTGIIIVFTVFVLAPIAVAAARLLWKRATNPPAPAIDKETAERLRRLEMGVDAIAIEVERISEGQRFVTNLMADREHAKLGVPRD